MGDATCVFIRRQEFRRGDIINVVCSSLNESSVQIAIDQCICPGVVEGSDNVTMADCQDVMQLMRVEAEALYRCPGNHKTWPEAHKAAKDAVCVFVRRQDARKDAVILDVCNKFKGRVLDGCTFVLHAAWARYEASCGDEPASSVVMV